MTIKRPVFAAAVLTVLLGVVPQARAQVDLSFGGFVLNDLRLSVDRVDIWDFYWNEVRLGADLDASLIPDRLYVVGDLQFVWLSFTQDTEFTGLTDYGTVSPYRLESDAAYLEVVELLPGLDLRMGRQIVNWGAADLFNPTNNLNALDLDDFLLFGDRVANQMIKLDWAPLDELILTAVWVPVFQPALLPNSALLAVGDTNSELLFTDPELRLEAERLRNIWLRNPESYQVEDPSVRAEMPDFSLANSQFAFRLQWIIGLFDTSVSYYRGFDSMPVGVESISTTFSTGRQTDSGTPVLGVNTDVLLQYPRKQVVGFDVAGQLPFLDDTGIWFEGAVTFPEEMTMEFDVTDVSPGAKVITGAVVDDTPFFKFTTGLDYTFNRYLYATGQFMRGFLTEFGASRLHYYWMGGFDVKLARERVLLRLFALGQLPSEDDDITLDDDNDGRPESLAWGATNDETITSYVIFPSITYKPMDALELILGGYVLLGHRESQFAQPAAGPSIVFFQTRASF